MTGAEWEILNRKPRPHRPAVATRSGNQRDAAMRFRVSRPFSSSRALPPSSSSVGRGLRVRREPGDDREATPRLLAHVLESLPCHGSVGSTGLPYPYPSAWRE